MKAVGIKKDIDHLGRSRAEQTPHPFLPQEKAFFISRAITFFAISYPVFALFCRRGAVAIDFLLRVCYNGRERERSAEVGLYKGAFYEKLCALGKR